MQTYTKSLTIFSQKNKMKTNTITGSLFLTVVTLLITFTTSAQEKKKFEVTPAADIVSSYVWRGEHDAGASIQPSLTLKYAGFSLEAWGSTDFSTSADEFKSKEFDITLGYQIKGFEVAITDYWWSGQGARYGRYATDHYFEGTVAYNFGEKLPLTLAWSTMFAGGDKDEEGKQYFSSYFEAAYEFDVWGGVTLTPSIGISPWTGMYSNGFGFNSISLKASKDIKITKSFSLPIFTEVIASPEHDDVFLVLGISL